MGFFATAVWLWIKRILFIAVMLICVLCSFINFSDSLSGLGVFLNILLIAIAIANCVLFFIFERLRHEAIIEDDDQKEKCCILFVNLGLVVQIILVFVFLEFGSNNEFVIFQVVSIILVLLFYNFKRREAIKNGVLRLAFVAGVVAGIGYFMFELIKAFKN